MLSLLNMNDPVIEDNSIIISTINKMNQKEVIGYKNKIQAFISKELNNYSITVDVSLDEVIAGNVEKLKKRYPGGDFDVYHSENRAADDR